MRCKRCLGWFAVIVLFVSVVAPVPAWAATTIRLIEVVGNQSVSTPAIKRMLRSREGGPYDPRLVEEDIRALFQRGDFADIRVEKEDVRGGIKLIYKMTERPLITKIRFEGNKKIKEKTMVEKIPIRLYRALNGAELAESINLIKELYRDKRFYMVDVDYDIVPSEGGAELVFRVKEHGRGAIRRIQIVGNRVFSDRQLKKIIKTKEKGSLIFRRGKFEQEALEQDVALLARHYLNNGYIRIMMAQPRIEISKDKRHIFVTFTIDEGQQYRISTIRIAGDILTTEEEIRSLLTTEAGDIYRHETVEEDLRKLVFFYGTLGYAFANIQPIPQPNDADGTTELVFAIQKGRRVTIDTINISGNTTTRDKVIRRELEVKEGDLFNRELIEESRAKVHQLGYFEDVEFATPRGRHPDSVNLNIIVKERATGTFNIGAGFSTAENFFFTGSVQKQNFFGYGISGQIAVELSKLRQQYVLSLSDPYFLDSEWIMSFSSYRTVFRYPEFDRKAWGGSLSLGHRLFKHATVDVGYKFEDVKATNFFFSVPETFRTNASGITSAMTLSLSYDTRDNRIYPSKGLFGSISNEISGSNLGGDNDFYRVNAVGRYYQPILKGINGRLFVKGGYIKNLGSRTVPLFERYLLGGPNSLRGYNIWTIGPSVRLPSSVRGGDTRFVMGGTKMVQANAEVEMPIYTPAGLKAVAFFDAGNSYGEDQSIDLKALRMNYGFGLRWISPLGPLRFEWGLPIQKKAGEPGVVFNFTIGEFY